MASKRASLASFIIENWRKKILPNERKRRKKKDLLSSAQPWRKKSSSLNFFFKIKIRLNLIFNIKI